MFGAQLKKYRKAAHMSQKELAGLLFVSQQAVAQWEKDSTTPNPEAIAKITQIFGISADELLDDVPRPSSSDSTMIPVLGSVPAGIPLEAIEDVIDWEEIPKSLTAGGKDYFALQVKGDSMYPDYLPGDIVIVRKTQQCECCDDCVVYVNGFDATLKQVKLGEHGELTLVPRNPQYPPRTFSPEEVAELPVAICGVVVELRRKIKR